MKILKTSLHDKHIQLNAKMVDFAGFSMPISYPSGINVECDFVRKNVGLFDVSHMGQILIEGESSLKFVEYLTSNNVSKLINNQCQYSLLCNDNGGIIDDLILYRINQDKFILVINASNIDKDYKWIANKQKDFCSEFTESSLFVKNLSSDISLIAVQGPNSRRILKNFDEFRTSVNDLDFYHFSDISDNHELRIISRTGYTGELGYEIYGSHNYINNIWDQLVEKLSVPPIGLAARDILRLEMCYRLYGNDMNEKISPYECGLGWVVKDLTSSNFVGCDAIRNIKKSMNQKLVCLEMKDKCIPRKGYRLVSNNDDVGFISSGAFSPNLKKGIAMAFIDFNKVDKNNLYVKIRDKMFLANIVNSPFLKETSLFE